MKAVDYTFYHFWGCILLAGVSIILFKPFILTETPLCLTMCTSSHCQSDDGWSCACGVKACHRKHFSRASQAHLTEQIHFYLNASSWLHRLNNSSCCTHVNMTWSLILHFKVYFLLFYSCYYKMWATDTQSVPEHILRRREGGLKLLLLLLY